jgi:divalent metal cation (Fe/Co/Zn/Cd) transporter
VLASALRVSIASAIWTLLASIALVVVGLRDSSLALVAFGSVGLFDFASDIVLVVHFRAALGQRDSAHLERVAIRIVGGGLLAVGGLAVVYSVIHLGTRHAAHPSSLSLVLSAVSLIALTALAIRKAQIAIQLPSIALAADGKLTTVGAALAAVTLAGTAALEAFDWWWADPIAALTIGLAAASIGFRELQAQGRRAST